MSDGLTVRVKLSAPRRRLPAAQVVLAIESDHKCVSAGDGESRITSVSTPAPTNAAKMLALAHFVEDSVQSGRVKSYKDAARRLGISESRINQIVTLLDLAPAVQEAVLTAKTDMSVRELQWLARSERQYRHQQCRITFPNPFDASLAQCDNA